MQNPGMRRRFVLKNRDEFSVLRAKAGMQKELVSQGLSPSTISRMERGFAVAEKGARAMHRIIAPHLLFEDMFEVASGNRGIKKLSWEQVSRSAARIGHKIFRDFQPHFVITFAGPSSLFTSLVMTRSLTREEFLGITIYTGIFHRKQPELILRGFDTIPTHRFLVHIPMAINDVEDRSHKRVMIVDDTVTTGSVMERLKAHLVKRGYRRNNIQYAACACSQAAFNKASTRPDIVAYKMKGSYRMPWGDPL